MALLFAVPAAAQVLPGAVTPGRDRAGPALPQDPDFDFSIVAPHRSPVPRAVDEVHFKLTNIKITGAITIPAALFRPLYANMMGKDITLADILTVADKIEAAYRSRGYLLVRAFVPPQRVRDGIFTINVVEGFLASITVQGGDQVTRALVREYLAPARAQRPLHLSNMERGLLLTNDIPGVNATGLLKPSPDTQGASDLVVDVTEPRLSGGISADNRGSRFSGIYTIAADAELNGVFGADQFVATLTASPNSLEQAAGSLRYRRAVGERGLTVSVTGSMTHGEPGSTLRAAGVLTDSWAVGPRLTFPLMRSRAETLLLDGGLTVQDAQIAVAGTGVTHDQWRVLDIGGSYQRQGDFGVWTTSLDIAQGLPVLGATKNHATILSRVGGVTDFTKITAFTRLALPLGNSFSALLSTQGQFSFSPLISGEQIAYGGTQIGRGYDPGAITGDHGIGGSAELRYDYRLGSAFLQAVEPYAYAEAAQTWYIRRGLSASTSLVDQYIASAGGGIRFWLPRRISAAIEGSRTLHAVPGSDGGKMATKFLFDLSVRF